MTRTLLIAGAVASLIAGPAFAQTATTPAPAMPQQNAPAAAAMSGQQDGGIKTATSAPSAVRFGTLNAADLMSSRLIGTDVYNNQNEEIGEIQDLMLADGKTLSGIVVSVGGFLGIGERYVLVDPASMVVSRENDGDIDKAFIDTTKENLSGAPEFDYRKDD